MFAALVLRLSSCYALRNYEMNVASLRVKGVAMMKRLTPLVCAMLLSACGPTVLTQPVPVSTDPAGVNVAVDGKAACVAPCQVDLARNQDHILTLTKDGYRQQDVLIKRQYQTNKVLLNAINQGAQSAQFFKDGWMGANQGVMSMNSQEETGEAYVLSPSTVSLRLVPVGGFPAKTTPEQAAQAVSGGLSPLDALDTGDQQMLENILETSRSGLVNAWTNTRTGVSFSLVPEHAEEENGSVVRWFTLAARQNDRTASGRYPAHRVGRGEWALSLPNQQTGAGMDKGAEDLSRRETLRALGQAPLPTVQKSWDVGSSGSSSTSTSTTAIPGGTSTTTTTKSTKTSTKASVGFNPAGLVNILDALQ